ncbi:MAG: hypothetical protein H6825_13045 [Planctomycetes bacterium]|nr:hypothetical protein [Planctomycetota bacterium]
MAAPRPARLLLLPAAFALLAFGNPTDPYASLVVDVSPGPFSGGDPDITLDDPHGLGPSQGSFHVFQLGVGGSITLRLDSLAKDGPGTDLIVYENPFFVQGMGDPTATYVEALYVEVSSNGLDFARFPTRYSGPAGPHLGPGGQDIGVPNTWYRGFAGVMTVSAGTLLGEDPFDVVGGGGDAFDFADLQTQPEVVQGDVVLSAIRYVRLVDVEGGVDVDGLGNPVWDAGNPVFSTADVDAVCVPNDEWDIAANGRPTVEMTLVNGFLAIEIHDSDGLSDVKFGLTASWDGIEFSFYDIIPLFVIVELSPDHIVLATGPVPSDFPSSLLKVSARDGSGRFGGDAIALP